MRLAPGSFSDECQTKAVDSRNSTSSFTLLFSVFPRSGSASQMIKVYNLDGGNLSTIRYHEGFMGQRIGPISCLEFHPHRVSGLIHLLYLVVNFTATFISPLPWASRNLGCEYCVTREENVFVGICQAALWFFFSVIARFIWLRAARIPSYRSTLLRRSGRSELIYDLKI